MRILPYFLEISLKNYKANKSIKQEVNVTSMLDVMRRRLQ